MHRKPTRIDRARARVPLSNAGFAAAGLMSFFATFVGVLYGWWLAQ